VQVAEVVEAESADDVRGRLGTLGFGDGDGAVQFHDWRAGEAVKLAVQRI
jgi:hypothetical protein